MRRITKAELEENNAQLREENSALIAFQKARAFPLNPLEKVTVLKAEGTYTGAGPQRWEADIHVLKPHRGDGGYVMILEHSCDDEGGRRLQHVSAMSGVSFVKFCRSREGSDRWQTNNWHKALAEYESLVREAL